jgi:predicted GNAT superfamily acetyltransferase
VGSAADPDDAAKQALALAERWSRSAGVQVAELHSLPELDTAERLYAAIWLPRANSVPITAELMRALTKAGNYLAGAYDGATLVGSCLGFFEEPDHRSMHSHIAGVLPAARGRNVGFALKAHQRAWALSRGMGTIAWTFDPLVRRNAYFNICKLAATPGEYLPNFYGDMDDGINGRGDTDRLLVRWVLSAPEVAAACAGRPRPIDAAALRRDGAAVALDRTGDGRPVRGNGRGAVVLAAVAEDIELLRTRDAGLAGEWQRALRDVLGGLLADGARVLGFDRAGWYAFARS